MRKNLEPVYYGDYLQLEKILSAQSTQSAKYGDEAHDETLFIVVHQAYELWFKQILHEMSSVLSIFSKEQVKDEQLTTVVHRLKRVIKIQELLLDQISVMETMTPQDFLEFRDYLVPASGFQSIQFKMLEIGLGLKSKYRIEFDKQSFWTRLEEKDRLFLQDLETKTSLFESMETWLERMPFLEFGEFNFWQHYQQATQEMLDSDEEIIRENHMLNEKEREFQLQELQSTRDNFAALLDAESFEKVREQGKFRLSQKATLAALFINLYQEEPIFNLPFQFLTCLMEVDEKLTLWRYRHAVMVQRMLGSKIGTGGSSGHEYLKKTTDKNRVFVDLFNMSTFLIPKNSLPELPAEVKKALGFYISG